MDTNLDCFKQTTKRHTMLRINKPLKYTQNTLQALIPSKWKHALNRFKTSGLNSKFIDCISKRHGISMSFSLIQCDFSHKSINL